MKKHFYKHLGYYEQAGDIKELAGKSADEIVDYWKKGYGAFSESDVHETDTDRILEEDYNEEDNHGLVKISSDKKYFIEDSSAYWEDISFLNEKEDGDSTEIYIDIWELYKEEDVEDEPSAIENAAYEIVCKMIDCGLVESEPEGKDWEHTIVKIIKKHI